MDQPKVSIVMPIYNAEPYLREALNSVVRQTLAEIEIVCVNDGSTDGSLAVIQEYAARDSRIVVLDGANGGYGKAMNRGTAAARGEYIGIVEPDDFVALTMYEDLYAIAVANDLDVAKADFYCFTRNGRGDMHLYYYPLDATGERYGQVMDTSEDAEALRLTMNTWSGIYRRSFLEEHGIRHNETPGASFQDNGFWIQTFVCARRVMIVDEPYYRYRRDNPNASVKDPGKMYCMNAEYDYIEKYLRERGLWERFGTMVWFLRFRNYLFAADRIDPSLMGEFMGRVKRDFARAEEAGELDASAFPEDQWKRLRAILASPSAYAARYAAERRVKRALKAPVMALKEKLPKF